MNNYRVCAANYFDLARIRYQSNQAKLTIWKRERGELIDKQKQIEKPLWTVDDNYTFIKPSRTIRQIEPEPWWLQERNELIRKQNEEGLQDVLLEVRTYENSGNRSVPPAA